MHVDQEALKAVIKEHLSASLKPKRKRSRYSLAQEKFQILEMIRNTVRETLEEMNLEKIMIEKAESIDWEEKMKEAVELGLKMARGIVE